MNRFVSVFCVSIGLLAFVSGHAQHSDATVLASFTGKHGQQIDITAGEYNDVRQVFKALQVQTDAIRNEAIEAAIDDENVVALVVVSDGVEIFINSFLLRVLIINKCMQEHFAHDACHAHLKNMIQKSVDLTKKASDLSKVVLEAEGLLTPGRERMCDMMLEMIHGFDPRVEEFLVDMVTNGIFLLLKHNESLIRSNLSVTQATERYEQWVTLVQMSLPQIIGELESRAAGNPEAEKTVKAVYVLCDALMTSCFALCKQDIQLAMGHTLPGLAIDTSIANDFIKELKADQAIGLIVNEAVCQAIYATDFFSDPVNGWMN